MGHQLDLFSSVESASEIQFPLADHVPSIDGSLPDRLESASGNSAKKSGKPRRGNSGSPPKSKKDSLWDKMLKNDASLRSLPQDEQARCRHLLENLISKKADVTIFAEARYAEKKTKKAPCPDAVGECGAKSPSFADALAGVPKRGVSYRFRSEYDLFSLASFSHVSVSIMRDMFSSGRYFSQIGESNAAKPFGFDLFPNKDVGGADGYLLSETSLVDDHGASLSIRPFSPMDFVSVKGIGLTGKVKFQLSCLTGAKRSHLCDDLALADSIRLTEWLCVTRPHASGHADFYLFPSSFALDWMSAGILTPGGLSAQSFLALLEASSEKIFLLSDRAKDIYRRVALENEAARQAFLAESSPSPSPA